MGGSVPRRFSGAEGLLDSKAMGGLGWGNRLIGRQAKLEDQNANGQGSEPKSHNSLRIPNSPWLVPKVFMGRAMKDGPALAKFRTKSKETARVLSVQIRRTLWSKSGSGQQTPRRWGLGNPAEETICYPNRSAFIHLIARVNQEVFSKGQESERQALNSVIGGGTGSQKNRLRNKTGVRKSQKNGGSGGARTRNLCRDRAAL
jgi:hypothetical protein